MVILSLINGRTATFSFTWQHNNARTVFGSPKKKATLTILGDPIKYNNEPTLIFRAHIAFLAYFKANFGTKPPPTYMLVTHMATNTFSKQKKTPASLFWPEVFKNKK